MASVSMLASVKSALGIAGTYQDATLTVYIDEVVDYLKNAGIPEPNITPGIVSRGVSDLWNYGEKGGELSTYFLQRAAQLSYK